jgi:lipopolysaccharide transport system ATP-binding protein
MAHLCLNNISVHFPIYGANATSLKQTIAAAATGGRIGKDTNVTVIEALRDISFTLHDGDRLGILGHNGSGKSTLLRVLAGVYPPMRGTIRRIGSVTSLIDPAVGIEQEATGQENIFLRGLVMGLTKAQIADVYDDICLFSGLGEYLSLPVRTYSTGMLMRLAFSIATSLPRDIVLMDEWLSVGDAIFQEQAELRLRTLTQTAGILVIATHSEALVARECNKRLLLQHGQIRSITCI